MHRALKREINEKDFPGSRVIILACLCNYLEIVDKLDGFLEQELSYVIYTLVAVSWRITHY